MSIKKDLQSIPERTSIKKILNGEAAPKRMIKRSELYTSQEPFGEKIHLNIQDKLKKANNEDVPLISMGETEESVHINSPTKTKLLADQNQADGFPLAYYDTDTLYQDGNEVTLGDISATATRKHFINTDEDNLDNLALDKTADGVNNLYHEGHKPTPAEIGAETPTGAQTKVNSRLSASEKTNLNNGLDPSGDIYYEDLVKQFRYEQKTEQIHGESCPGGDTSDYYGDQRGILLRVKYPILLRDFKFNYEFTSSVTVTLKIQKFNSDHSALSLIFNYDMTGLTAITEHQVYPFHTPYGSDMEVYLRPGDYYISILGEAGKIEVSGDNASDADKWENNYVVALQGHATGTLPSWSTLWGQDNANWYFIFDLEFDTLNKNSGLGHFASVIIVDDLLEGSWFTYNKAGVPSRVQLMNGTRHWTDPGGTL